MKPDYDAIQVRWLTRPLPAAATMYQLDVDIRALLTRALLLEAVYEAAKGIDYSEDLDDALAALDAALVVVSS